MKPHFLQSPTWEAYQKLEGYQTFRLHSDDYDILAILETTPIGNYLYCPYGPTLVHPTLDNLNLALNALRGLAVQHHAFFIRIEPTFSLPHPTSLHLKKSHDLNPAHTWVLDLTQPETTIFANMEKEKGRLWRNYAKKGIKIRQTKDPAEISILTNLLAGVSSRNHFIPQSTTHLQDQLKAGFATLYIAELDPHTLPVDDQQLAQPIPIAASLVYDYAGTRFYAHAAADQAHRKLVAGTILLVQMIIDAKAAGQESFDFWGITTSTNPKHPWYGFTQYKKSFGGHQVDYAGTWDLPLNPVRYRLYQALRQTNRLRRHLHH